uniref:Ovule protein n=1 Tax=Steinernema glaseri TaxID=37863 RepID=A0A1I8ASL8_9BILA
MESEDDCHRPNPMNSGSELHRTTTVIGATMTPMRTSRRRCVHLPPKIGKSAEFIYMMSAREATPRQSVVQSALQGGVCCRYKRRRKIIMEVGVSFALSPLPKRITEKFKCTNAVHFKVPNGNHKGAISKKKHSYANCGLKNFANRNN